MSLWQNGPPRFGPGSGGGRTDGGNPRVRRYTVAPFDAVMRTRTGASVQGEGGMIFLSRAADQAAEAANRSALAPDEGTERPRVEVFLLTPQDARPTGPVSVERVAAAEGAATVRVTDGATVVLVKESDMEDAIRLVTG